VSRTNLAFATDDLEVEAHIKIDRGYLAPDQSLVIRFPIAVEILSIFELPVLCRLESPPMRRLLDCSSKVVGVGTNSRRVVRRIFDLRHEPIGSNDDTYDNGRFAVLCSQCTQRIHRCRQLPDGARRHEFLTLG